MRLAALGDRIGVAYKRVGPSRLPGADRHDIGAGYAGASAALVPAAMFSALVDGLGALGSPIGVGDPVLVVVAASAPVRRSRRVRRGRGHLAALPWGTPLLGAIVGVM